MKRRVLLFLAACIGLAGTAYAGSLMEPAGIPDRFIGASNAPSTLVVYSSPTCGHCIRFEEQLLPLIKSRYVDSGRLRVTVRSVPNNAVDGAILLIAHAAGAQRREATLAHFRARRAEIVAAKDREKVLRKIAAECAVHGSAFDRAMQDSVQRQALQRLSDQADREFGITGTPTMFLDGVKLPYDGTMACFARQLDAKPPR